ncbi:hypothetical protein OG563_26715 [Nocardia vinacea]|uniref:Uncharacterized protein n=1 Tax=Nocardia vinacea TaxID=96468 RepID=A0ABZ1YI14_9NOCA|nr:hypothetical protein [Nocardia vinacea]
MANNGKPCLFCQTTDNSSREHVLRKEMGNLLGLRKGWTHTRWQSLPDADGMQESSWQLQNSMYDWQVKTVCNPCNNGWMNEIDQAVESILFDLAEGRTVQITAEQAERLIAWAAKTVAVYASGEPGESIIARKDLDWIYRSRTAPRAWQVWVSRANLAADRQVIARHLRVVIQDEQLGDEAVHATVIAQKSLAIFVRGTAGMETNEFGMQSSSVSPIDEHDNRFVQLTRRSTADVSLNGRAVLNRDQLLGAVSAIMSG